MELSDIWNLTAQKVRRDYDGTEIRDLAIKLSGLPKEAQQYEPWKRSDGTLVYHDSSLFHHECVSHMKHLDAAGFEAENSPVFTWTKEEEVNPDDYADEKYPRCGWCDESIVVDPDYSLICDKDKHVYGLARSTKYWTKLNEAVE